MSLSLMMAGSILGIIGVYILVSVILLKKPQILHKKHKKVFYASHISHRGGAGERIENTMPAFKHAVNLHTEMIELDCHLLSNGQVVVTHDEDLMRITGVDTKVYKFTIDSLPPILDKLQITFSPDKLSVTTVPEEKKFVLLEDVFKSFPTLPINVDIKIDNDKLIENVNKLVIQYGREELTAWGNRSHVITDKCYRANPNIGLIYSQRQIIKTIVLFYLGLLPFVPIREKYFEIPMLSVFLEPEFQIYKFGFKSRFLVWLLDKLLMNSVLFHHLERRGISTFVWVCNKTHQFDRAFKLGVEGVMTDYPSLLRKYLNEHPQYDRGRSRDTGKHVESVDETRPIINGDEAH